MITKSEMKKILIVDDSTISRMTIRTQVLAKYPDCVVLEAASGDEALAFDESEAPDLITIDINMPGMSSYDAAVQLHKKYPNARMAVITANVQKSVRTKIQSLGIMFAAVIEKPITESSIQKIFAAL